MTIRRRPDALFDDALFGADGMAEPAPDQWAATYFADALAAPTGDAAPRLVLPEVALAPTVRELTAPLDDAPAAPPVGAPVARSVALPRDSRRRGDAEIAFTATPIPRAARPVAPPPAAPGAAPFAAPGAAVPPVPWPTNPQGPAQSWQTPGAAFARSPRPPSQYPRPPAQHPQRAARPSRPVRRRSRGGGFVAIFVIILFLVISNAGRDILDAIARLLNP